MKEHPRHSHTIARARLALWLLCASGATWGADSPRAASANPDSPTEIVVSTPRGSAGGGIDPLLRISPAELDSYGADSLSDLVDDLRPMTRSSKSDQTAVVLINGHLAGQTEFDNLPREAVERVEVLPESVALQYGFSENRRVLNVILREHYRAVPLRVTESGATEGGDQSLAADSSLVYLEDEARATVLASYKDNAWLRESDRGIEAPDNAYRTLQPDTRETKLAATVSHGLWGVSNSLEASYDVLSTNALQGLAAAPDGTAVPLRAASDVRTSRVAWQLTGLWNDVIWGATAYYLHVISRSTSDVGVAAGGDSTQTSIDRTQSAFDAGNVQLSASGRMASLPAGSVIANVKCGLQYQGFDTRDVPPGAAGVSSHLVRTVRTGNFNVSVPLANANHDVLPALGNLAGTFNATLDDVSQFGTLFSTSVGLDWTPLTRLHVNAIYTDHRTAPTVQQLRSPPIITSNVETFDYVNGQTVYVTEVTGGNATLASTDGRQASLGVSVGPFMGKTEFLARYEESWTHDAIGAVPPTTADVERAFPERFVRDADGTLIDIDDRWVNLGRQRIDDVKWGVNVWIPWGDSPPQSMANRVEFSLFDTWYIRDVTVIRAGIAQLDLLGGAPSDVTGGQPRHKIEFHSLVHRDGIGVLLAVAWRSPTVVGSGDPAAPDPLDFSSLGTADLRVFLDLGRQALLRDHPWAAGARLALSVTNLFDRRQTVHAADGTTPTAFEPGYLDPPGRVLALTARKVF